MEYQSVKAGGAALADVRHQDKRANFNCLGAGYDLAHMLYQIVSLLLEVVAGVLSGACLLRLYMQYQRVPMSVRSGNPLGRFVFALTDWIVLPLRRVLPAIGALDTASLVAAFVLQLGEFGILWLLAGASGGLAAVPILALFGLVRMAISGMTGAVIVYAILSWVQTNSMIGDVLERLVAPLLMPIRRVLPLVGGVDLSPLALLVILQISAIVLGNLQAAVLLLV
jgi:YggT family protein